MSRRAGRRRGGGGRADRPGVFACGPVSPGEDGESLRGPQIAPDEREGVPEGGQRLGIPADAFGRRRRSRAPPEVGSPPTRTWRSRRPRRCARCSARRCARPRGHRLPPALLGLDLAVPDHSTLSRRAETLEVPRPSRGPSPCTCWWTARGCKLCGPGEWLAEKHGTKRRRAWRELHLATDADTGRIVATALTDRDADDGSQVGPLLDRVDGPAASFTADGAYDRDDVYAEVAARHPEAAVVVPPRSNAVPSQPRRPRRRSAMPISDASPSAAGWAGSRPRGTTSAPWWSPTSRDGSGSPATGYASRRTGDRHRGGHRRRRAEPNAGPGTPEIRPVV